jgi:hypothetical protein
MKTPRSLLMALALAALPAFAQEKPAATPPAKKGLIVYAPPKTPKGARVDGDGGSRAGGVKLPSIYVLAPRHVALTTQAQPALFWYQTGAAVSEFELTVTEPKKAQPLLNVRASSKLEEGMHSVSLARQKTSLAPKTTYQWSVALIADPANRSKDVIASGIIERVEPPAALAAKIEKASHAERAALYAEGGYWYDALQSISIAIGAEKEPARKTELTRARAALLNQADLPAAVKR